MTLPSGFNEVVKDFALFWNPTWTKDNLTVPQMQLENQHYNINTNYSYDTILIYHIAYAYIIEHSLFFNVENIHNNRFFFFFFLGQLFGR